jgi:hypothetical protein
MGFANFYRHFCVFLLASAKKLLKERREDGLIDYFMKMSRMKRDEMHIEREIAVRKDLREK